MKHITKITAISLMLSLSVLSCTGVSTRVDVIPYPNDVKVSGSAVNFAGMERIVYPSELSSDAAFLQKSLKERGYNLQLDENGKHSKGAVTLSPDTACDREAYTLKASTKGLKISGGQDGVFWGIQTLLQELDHDGLNAGTIQDSPRYGWRGFMLDEARHFFGEQTVCQLLDVMAYYKINKFHWHLTDAQGWRIEIKGYPKLATVGGIGTHSDPDAPVQYYTQEQIRRIVDYAAERHIEVIPEVDMPGHASAANRAYPQFNGGGTPQFADFTFNVGKEETYAFLTAVLREVGDLFPSQYIHIGGDEVFYGSSAWNSDPYVQSLMHREGLATVQDAEGYFVKRITDSLKVMGKKVIAWDDVLDFELDKDNNYICWWRHDRPQSLRKSLEKGYTTIMCPRKPMYYDFIQDSTHTCGRIWDGFCPLEDVYAFPDAWYEGWQLTEADMGKVIGIQSNLWTELVHNRDRFDFMIFPRICALAESGWTLAENKDYADFSRRMESAYRMFDEMGIYYFDARDPKHHSEPAGPVIKKRDAPKPKMDYRD